MIGELDDDFPMGPLQAVRARRFEDAAVRRILDAASVARIVDLVGPPALATTVAEPRGSVRGGSGWQPGEPLPALRDEDPAVMQAVGRCAVSRLQHRCGLEMRSLHDRDRCAWCAYPLAELLAGCDWAVHRSRFVVLETATWWADQTRRAGPTYRRIVRHDVHEHPGWAAFWAQPRPDRERLVAAAQYPDDQQPVNKGRP